MSVLYSIIALALYLAFMFSINLFRIHRFEKAIFYQSLLGLAGAVTVCVAFRYVPSFRVSFVDLHWFLILLFVNVFFLGGSEVRFPPFMNRFIVMVSVVFLSPFSEELFFRGVFLKLNGNDIWTNALVFSFLHLFNVIVGFERFSFANLIYRFVVALIFAHSAAVSGSLFPAVLYHITNNLVAFILMTRRGRNVHNVRGNRRIREEHTDPTSGSIPGEERKESDLEERAGRNGDGGEDQKDSSGGRSNSQS